MAQEHIARLFLTHQDLLRDYLRGMVRDAHAAEDLFQELGVRVLTHAEPPDAPEAFVPWCRGIARNLLLQHWRSARRSKVIACEALVQAVDRAFDEAHDRAAEWAERRLVLGQCLEHLPPQSRALVAGHYVEGRSLADLAGSTGKSEAALKMTLLRIRQSLRTCVQSKLKDGDL